MKMTFKRLESLYRTICDTQSKYLSCLHWTLNVLVVHHPEEKEKASEITRREQKFLFNHEELRP